MATTVTTRHKPASGTAFRVGALPAVDASLSCGLRPGAGHLPRRALPALRRGAGVSGPAMSIARRARWSDPMIAEAGAPLRRPVRRARRCGGRGLHRALRARHVAGDTVPHRGSWLIWGVLEVVALQAQRADGASWSLVPLMIQALGTCLVLTLSFRFGTGGLGPADLALLALAGLGIVGWLVVQRRRRRHGLRHRSGPDRGHHDGTQGVA